MKSWPSFRVGWSYSPKRVCRRSIRVWKRSEPRFARIRTFALAINDRIGKWVPPFSAFSINQRSGRKSIRRHIKANFQLHLRWRGAVPRKFK